MNTKFFEMIFKSDKKLATVIDQDINGVPYDAFRKCAPLSDEIRSNIQQCSFKTTNVEKLGDFIENSIDWPLCSARLIDLIQEFNGAAVEVVGAPPLIDQKGQESRAQFLFNPLLSVPCIDLKKSNVAYSNDGSIRGIYDIALDGAAVIPPGAHIFRPAEWSAILLVTEAMAKAMTAQKFSGITFQPTM